MNNNLRMRNGKIFTKVCDTSIWWYVLIIVIITSLIGFIIFDKFIKKKDDK